MNYHDALLNKIQDRSASLAVIGLGYVGLPLAVAFAEAGFEVIGIDQDGDKVTALNQGTSYIRDIDSQQVARLVNSGKLKASTDASLLAEVDAASICVPTPLRKTGDPDLSYVVSVAEELVWYGHPGR